MVAGCGPTKTATLTVPAREPLADGGAVAVDEVEGAAREARLVDALGEEERRERRDLPGEGVHHYEGEGVHHYEGTCSTSTSSWRT